MGNYLQFIPARLPHIYPVPQLPNSLGRISLNSLLNSKSVTRKRRATAKRTQSLTLQASLRNLNRRLHLLLQKFGFLTKFKLSSSPRPGRPVSHPLSRNLRPILEKKSLRTRLGIFIAAFTLALALISPRPVVSDYSPPVLEVVSLSPQAVELTTQQGVRYPLDRKMIVNQGFHSWHLGVDLEGDTGDSVHPIMKGRIATINSQSKAYGNHIIIDHGQGLSSLYAHLSRVDVHVDQPVTIDDVIGRVGSTGHSSGSHLHLEVIDQGQPINPLSLFTK